MNDNGRLCDVLIEESSYRDDVGLEHFVHLTVWADPGLKNVIAKVPGVTDAFNSHTPTQYTVFLDPRYDRDWIKKEIEAQVKIHGGG